MLKRVILILNFAVLGLFFNACCRQTHTVSIYQIAALEPHLVGLPQRKQDPGYISKYHNRIREILPFGYQYGILLQIRPQIISKSVTGWTPDISLIPSAYACDESTDEFILRNQIDSLKIIALSEFDQDHPVGSSVNDLFKIAIVNSGALNTQYNRPDLEGIVPINTSLKKSKFDGPAELMLLLETIQFPNPVLEFEVRLYMEGQNPIVARTKPIFVEEL